MSVAHAGDVERRAPGDGVWERDLGAGDTGRAPCRAPALTLEAGG